MLLCDSKAEQELHLLIYFVIYPKPETFKHNYVLVSMDRKTWLNMFCTALINLSLNKIHIWRFLGRNIYSNILGNNFISSKYVENFFSSYA